MISADVKKLMPVAVSAILLIAAPAGAQPSPTGIPNVELCGTDTYDWWSGYWKTNDGVFKNLRLELYDDGSRVRGTYDGGTLRGDLDRKCDGTTFKGDYENDDGKKGSYELKRTGYDWQGWYTVAPDYYNKYDWYAVYQPDYKPENKPTVYATPRAESRPTVYSTPKAENKPTAYYTPKPDNNKPY